MVYFDPIIQHSAGNDLFASHTFIVAPVTDQSTFTTQSVDYHIADYQFSVLIPVCPIPLQFS